MTSRSELGRWWISQHSFGPDPSPVLARSLISKPQATLPLVTGRDNKTGLSHTHPVEEICLHTHTRSRRIPYAHTWTRAACTYPSGALVLQSPCEKHCIPSVWGRATWRLRISRYSERSQTCDFFFSLGLFFTSCVCLWTCLHQGVFFTCLRACVNVVLLVLHADAWFRRISSVVWASHNSKL